ncbi:MAG: hypothetical protein ACLFV8_06875 [Alphaproteobacteria bacterium]
MQLRAFVCLAAALMLTTVAVSAAPTDAGGGRVYKTGTAILKGGQTYDLDRARHSEWGADIHLKASPRSLNPPELAPKLAAEFGFIGKVRPDFRRCNRAARSSSPIRVSMLKKGMHVCVRTTSGNVGYLTVVAPYNPRENAMGFRFRLWEKPQCCAIAGGHYRVDRGKCAREGKPVPEENCRK